MGYKTVVINEECKVNLEQNSIVFNIDGEKLKVYIKDLNCVIFNNQKVIITIPLISRLMEDNVCIIICDSKNDPMGSFLPFNGSSQPYKHIKYQIRWNSVRKKQLWKLIIENKIKSEYEALKLIGKDNKAIEQLVVYGNDVKSGDKTNREGIAAREYFKGLFGSEYFRHADDVRNYAMNYGYKIIVSYISKQIVARGYLTQVGIHHCGETNPYNLTYDFIEPFRVIVDIWVEANINKDSIFTTSDRMNLVNILNCTVPVGGKTYYLSSAIDIILDSYISFLEERCDSVEMYNVMKISYEA